MANNIGQNARNCDLGKANPFYYRHKVFMQFLGKSIFKFALSYRCIWRDKSRKVEIIRIFSLIKADKYWRRARDGRNVLMMWPRATLLTASLSRQTIMATYTSITRIIWNMSSNLLPYIMCLRNVQLLFLWPLGVWMGWLDGSGAPSGI